MINYILILLRKDANGLPPMIGAKMATSQKNLLLANNKIVPLPPRQRIPPASPSPAIFFGPIATSVHYITSLSCIQIKGINYSKIPIQEVEPCTSRSDFILPLSLVPPATTTPSLPPPQLLFP
jgi:hypothetical protein